MREMSKLYERQNDYNINGKYPTNDIISQMDICIDKLKYVYTTLVLLVSWSTNLTFKHRVYIFKCTDFYCSKVIFSDKILLILWHVINYEQNISEILL